MVSDALTEKVYYALNREYMRRLLTKYFWQKGFKEQMEAKIYPPILQDLSMTIPNLMGKIEIEPEVCDVDPTTGIVTLEWNMFILGNKRMFLGESTHTDLSELRSPLAGIGGNKAGIRRLDYATPMRVINFIINILGEHKMGDLSQTPKAITLSPLTPYTRGIGDTSGYFKRRPL
jgi:hypothetical protein